MHTFEDVTLGLVDEQACTAIDFADVTEGLEADVNRHILQQVVARSCFFDPELNQVVCRVLAEDPKSILAAKRSLVLKGFMSCEDFEGGIIAAIEDMEQEGRQAVQSNDG